MPGPLSVGLHHNTKTIPSGQRRIGEHSSDDVQRHVQPVCFLGIDVETDACLCGLSSEFQTSRRQFQCDCFALTRLVSGMEGREFDRNARIGGNLFRVSVAGNGLDRGPIGLRVAHGIRFGPCCFAQHVEGIGIALLLHALAAFQGLTDVLAQHELAAQFFHRAGHGSADDRLAHPADEATQRADDTWLLVLQNTAGEHQTPCRGVDQIDPESPA